MNPSHAIAAALDAALEASVSPFVYAYQDRFRFELSLAANTSVGVALHELHCTLQPEAEFSADQLRNWGNRLGERMTYLMEPLRVLEVDDEQGVACLRSNTPTPRGSQRSFYEILLNRTGSLSLNRISFNEEDRRRTSTEFQLSREILERFADDLAATIPL